MDPASGRTQGHSGLDRNAEPKPCPLALAGVAGRGIAGGRVDHLWNLYKLTAAYCEACAGACRMMFERLWVLLFLPVPLAWMAWEWRKQMRLAPLVMKTG